MTLKGIDVSSYQSTTYDTTGLSFVVVKRTEGEGYVNPRATAQVAHGRAAGLLVGHYHYPHIADGAAGDADYFLGHLGSDLHAGDVLVLDWEWYGQAGVTAAQADAFKDAWIARVKAKTSGHRVLVYADRNNWLNVDRNSNAGDGLWIADYVTAGQPRIKSQWLFHQYSSSPIDQNVANPAIFPTAEALHAWAAFQEADVALTADDIDKVAAAVVTKLLAGGGALEDSDLKRIWGADVVPAAQPPYNNSDYFAADGKTPQNTTWKASYAQYTQVMGIRETLARVKQLQDALAALDPAALEAALVAKLNGLQVQVTVTEPKGN
ncbi:glycoside hydrolase family 25 protein [Streptomyces bungoensis]|uniref:glycoside hydrolase family 25 protein n=1 Tax=Streptomyces bungoensis TaxID=285568 RepID=UPI0034226803